MPISCIRKHSKMVYIINSLAWCPTNRKENKGFPGGASGKEPTCQCRRYKRRQFDPWVGKIPWKGAWQPTPVFLPGESHGQRSLVATVHRSAESDTAEQLSTCSTMIIVPVINDRLRVPVAHGDSLGPGDLVHLGASPSPGFPLHTDSSLTWTRSWPSFFSAELLSAGVLDQAPKAFILPAWHLKHALISFRDGYDGSGSKRSTCNAGDLGLIPESGRSPGEGNGYLLQDSCLENPMDRGTWRATVHGVAKVRPNWATSLSLSFHT